MNPDHQNRPQPASRREVLRRGSALAAAAAGSLVGLGCQPRTRKPPPIKIGLLHSQTGTMAISETSLRDIELFAIEEINAAGGVLGRLIEPVVEDPRSRFADLFPKRARKLLLEDRVAAVFGCWTSASRKAVLPVFEELGGLLFYPVQYEGNECSPNIVYTGSIPNQQILPALDWLCSPGGGAKRRIFLIGSDYIYPWTANHVIESHLASTLPDVTVVGKRYLPLGHRDFAVAVNEILSTEPDAIISTVNGDSNIHFYNELASAGVKADELPVMATSIGEDELRGLLPDVVEGHLAAWDYFQSIDTPINRDFVSRFKHEHGEDRVLDDPMESAYIAVHLWKRAAEIAKSFEVPAIRKALASGIEFEAPGGLVRIDPKTQHLYKHCRIGRIRKDRQFDTVWEEPMLIPPDPYPQDAFPGWDCDWTQGGLTKGAPVRIEP